MPLKDKQKRAVYDRLYRSQNKQKIMNRDSIRRSKKREWFKAVKTNLSCIKCGENRIICLDFHHRDPNEKEGNLSFIIYSWSKKRILAEIAKCDVLCANCHRVEHEGGT